MSTTADFGRGKTIFVLAIVIGCFAVLWPKIFYPMLTASISQTQADNVPIPPPRAQTVRKGAQQSICCDVISERDTNAYLVMTGICSNIMRNYEMIQEQQRQQQQQQQQGKQRKYTPVVKVSTVTLCRNEILQTCGVDIIALLKEDPSITTEYKKSLGQLRSFNTSLCMKMNYGVDFREIGQARKIKGPEVVPSHVRQERPFRPGPDMVHPALRERGRGIPTVNIPRRTIEREARPGPVPGMRPPVGGAGHIAQQKGGGTMGIIMPMYTIGIVCFFLYTILKILFKKSPEAEQAKPPPVKEYGLETEHRKYYEEQSVKEALYKEDMGLRRRPSGGKTRFYEDRRKLDDNYGTPAVSSVNEPRSIPSQDNAQPSRNEEPVVTAVKGIVEAFDATKTTVSPPPPSSAAEGKRATAQRAEEDLEKLISKGESKSKKEDLAATATAAGKEKRREKTPSRSTEKEVKFKLPPEEMEEEEVEPELARPPTPPKTLSKAKTKSSAAAAIAQAKAAGASSPSPTSGVSVIGIEETASLITGERWDLNRTPTPTFRQPTPPMPHRPPSPPDNIPSIYLEGPMPTRGQELVVRESQIEVEGDEYDYEFDDEYEPSGPVILSGKVTLSVISSAAGPFITDEVTDAPSLSLDDRAQAEHSSRGKSPAGATGGSRKNVAAEIASAMNDEVKGKSKAGKKSSNASSPDMDEYEVIGKGGYRGQDEETDVSLDDYLTATDAEPEGDRAQEDTAADISTMDDLKPEQLPPDEE